MYKRDCDDLFAQFDVKDSIDILHAVVTEAQARAKSGKTGPDVWKETMEPRASIRARTVPVLEKEKRRLQEVLDSVCFYPIQLDEEPYIYLTLERSWRRTTSDFRTNLNRTINK
jgi:Nnf1